MEDAGSPHGGCWISSHQQSCSLLLLQVHACVHEMVINDQKIIYNHFNCLQTHRFNLACPLEKHDKKKKI